jgi:hypothetical protein
MKRGSPVVFWTSRWVPTGKTQTVSNEKGDIKQVPHYRLEGKLNTEWRGYKHK